tara:strand:- start:24 stop:407 length:384 start_codon:yes stop_codon:yes gene_type:complete
MVSRSTTATIARKKKATLKMAARETEIIWGAWEERERGRSSGSDGVGVAHRGARDVDGGECLSLAHLGECGSTVCAIKKGMLRGDISTAEEEKACEPIGKEPEVAARRSGHKRGEREKGTGRCLRCT